MGEFPRISNYTEFIKSRFESVGAYGTTLSFLPDDLPDGNGKLVVAKDGRKLRESPLLSKWGHVPR